MKSICLKTWEHTPHEEHTCTLISGDEVQSLLMDSFSTSIEYMMDCPILFPKNSGLYFKNKHYIPIEETKDPFWQYLYIAQIKMYADSTNLTMQDEWYLRHLYRSSVLLRSLKGTVLDIGCDNPILSSKLFPKDAHYLGIEPLFSHLDIFHLLGMSEFLPLKDESMDNACFLTSLDHILDYHRALDEAHRILKKDGYLYIASLLWTHDAELYKDSVHFHHLRDYELINALLSKFHIIERTDYTWKHDNHRYGTYIKAQKK